MSIFSKVLRAGEGKKIRRLGEVVPLINDLEDEMHSLSDDELKGKTAEFKERLDNGESLDDILIEAFAVVRESSDRVIGQRHYDVQLMGGMALHFGWIAEMKTGEGKTLVSTLPVYLNALSGDGVHVITVNEYLASRDAQWMGRIHNFLGLSVGIVNSQVIEPEEKRRAYSCDITYGTNNEFGFDYLRDNMARQLESKVQRGHYFAIVDEVDSILIDEARTPLIISGPSEDSSKLYYQFAAISRSLKEGADYDVDEDKKSVFPTEEGIAKVEKSLGLDNLYDDMSTNLVLHLTQALRAKELYTRDRDYIVQNGEVQIVDEHTGRILDGRRWSEGLHQAVEAKERVKIKDENHTWATVTLQNYFRMYTKLSGMTGTAETEASEFLTTYKLPVVPIPTHLPLVREDKPDVIYKTEDIKFKAVVKDIMERYETGQPVLVGTASVAKSEQLSSLLDKEGIPHQVLNAKLHFREADIVAQAGRLHAITVATNMAGRGVDILLGGNPEGLAEKECLALGLDEGSEEYASKYESLLKQFKSECEFEGFKIRELGGLYVLGSERHESRRIDNQLRGRAGRQGDPGESRFYLSLEDDLLRIFATGAVSWVMDKTIPDEMPIEAKLVTRSIERAQTKVEGRNAEIRKDVLKYDEVMNEQRKIIYELRDRVLAGEDLYEKTLGLIEDACVKVTDSACPSEFEEQWNLSQLISALREYYPTGFAEEDLAKANNTSQIKESIIAEALEFYAKKDEEYPGGDEMARAVERDIMLQVIDTRWREHLSEMDYLREGIGLRAMGQQDPLAAWQREGFEMFTALLGTIDDDYLKYVFHVQVAALAPMHNEMPDLSKASYYSPSDTPGDSLSQIEPETMEIPTAMGPNESKPVDPKDTSGENVTVKKSDREKLGRNDICWCGSNKKFKFCHGAR
ncbi:MAG: preprotein translocase subunit SecA [Acidimicrobiales bacterium]|nr:preprotein translocase subunit SecA [Acidimicrobiales bacterium]